MHETINFYEALRQMEQSTESFSVGWCTYSDTTGLGGSLHYEYNVRFAGKRVTDDYELVFFRAEGSDKPICCHVYALMYFNDLKMIIDEQSNL